MKKEDFISKISEKIYISAEKLKEIFTSENEDIEIPEIKTTKGEVIAFNDLWVFTPSELKTSMENAGKTAVEKEVKAQRDVLKEEHGVDFTGKTLPNLYEAAINAGIKKGEESASVKPAEALKVKDEIIIKLKEQQKIDTQKIESLESDLNNTRIGYDIDSTLLSLIPQIDTLPFTKEDYMALYKKDFQVSIEDGKKVIKRNGEILRVEKTQEPLTIEQHLQTWLTEKNIVAERIPGRGEGDAGGEGKKTEFSSIKNSDDFYKYIESNEIPNNKQSEVLLKIQKENPHFVLE